MKSRKHKLNVYEMRLLSYFFSFRNQCGNNIRNKSLYTSNLNFLTSSFYTLQKLLRFNEKNKALQWKLKTPYPFFYLLMVNSLIKIRLRNFTFRVQFIHLFNKFYRWAKIEWIGHSFWFFSLSNENMYLSKVF